MTIEGAASGDVAVVMVNYRTPELALASVAALAAERGSVKRLRVIIVDGGSGDNSAARLAQGLRDPRFDGWADLLALPINGGFGWANNQAMLRLLQAGDPPDYIHLLNPDTIVEPGAIAALVREMEAHPRCAAVGSLLLELDGRPSGSAFRFPTPLSEFSRGARLAAIDRVFRIPQTLMESDRAFEAEWVTGASVLLHADALRQVGLFDDGFFLYFEEVELMWRLHRAGWSLRHQPLSRVRHVGGAATGVNVRPGNDHYLPRRPRYWYESRRRFFARTRGVFGPLIAGGAWLVASPIWWVRSLLGLVGTQRAVEHETGDLLKHGLFPRASDRVASIPRADSPIGTDPAWMRPS
jgi:GT2 family glycosyltransferase